MGELATVIVREPRGSVGIKYADRIAFIAGKIMEIVDDPFNANVVIKTSESSSSLALSANTRMLERLGRLRNVPDAIAAKTVIKAAAGVFNAGFVQDPKEKKFARHYPDLMCPVLPIDLGKLVNPESGEGQKFHLNHTSADILDYIATGQVQLGRELEKARARIARGESVQGVIKDISKQIKRILSGLQEKDVFALDFTSILLDQIRIATGAIDLVQIS